MSLASNIAPRGGWLRCLVIILLCIAALGGCDRSPENAQPAATIPSSSSPPSLDPSLVEVATGYVGSSTCGNCHQQAFQHWQQSHHAMAMAVPNEQSVVGDFGAPPLTLAGQNITFHQAQGNYTITLDSDDGSLQGFRVAYTFGVSPLQQYLTDLGNGRLQALPVVWDNRGDGQRWYHLQPSSLGKPEDVLHWTGSGQNWNHMCADCHATQVQKRFDPDTNAYDTSFAETGVGCEACHGPGLAHSQQPQQFPVVSLADPRQRMDLCASCHSRRTQIAEGFQPGKHYLDFYSPALLDDGLYFSDGQILDEVFVYGSFLQSKMHGAGVTCGDCHDPHTGQLQRSGNEVCTACHSPNGAGRFPGLQAKVYDSPEHHFHSGQASQGAAGTACVDCHMVARTYMGIDGRRDHSFRVPRPDLSVAPETPNACTGCHQDRDAGWAAQRLRDLGVEPAEHYASVIASARGGKQSAQQPLKALAGNAEGADIVQATALSLMTAYPPSPVLVEALANPQPLIRLGALRGLANSAAQVWPSLVPLLDDPLRAIRFAAITALLPAYEQMTAVARSRLDQSLEEYLSYLASNADRAEALTNRALVHGARGDREAAQADLTLALQRNPSWVPAMVNLADLYRATNRDAEAGELLQRAMELSPQTGQVRVAKALWHVRQGDVTRAIELLGQGHQQQPQLGSGYIYAVALNSVGRPEQALDVIDDLIAADVYSAQLLHLGLNLAQEYPHPKRRARYQKLLSYL